MLSVWGHAKRKAITGLDNFMMIVITNSDGLRQPSGCQLVAKERQGESTTSPAPCSLMDTLVCNEQVCQAACVFDPDDNHIEAVHHGREASDSQHDW